MKSLLDEEIDKLDLLLNEFGSKETAEQLLKILRSLSDLYKKLEEKK